MVNLMLDALVVFTGIIDRTTKGVGDFYRRRFAHATQSCQQAVGSGSGIAANDPSSWKVGCKLWDAIQAHHGLLGGVKGHLRPHTLANR